MRTSRANRAGSIRASRTWSQSVPHNMARRNPSATLPSAPASSAATLVELVSDVLDVAHFDSGKIELQETEFSLAALFNDEARQLSPMAREKQLKKWNRDWKVQLIEKDNLEWRDLSDLIT